jgi:membrane-associated phospholipid phosphatase
LVVLAACGIAAIPFLAAGFSLDAGFLPGSIEAPAAGGLAGRLLMRYRQTYRLGGAIEGSLLMSFVGLFGVMAAYSAAAAGFPLADAALLNLDQAIGYDWIRYAKFCADHHYLRSLLYFAYFSMFLQPIAIISLLTFTGNQVRSEKFILANLTSLSLTVTMFLFLPATTAWTFANQEQLAARLLSSLPLSGNSWMTDLLSLRSGGGRHLTMAAGIIAFPSFHCVSALLSVWAAWPVRRLRVPLCLLNLLMIASAPIFGGHYATDLIGGAVVAAITIALINPLHRRLVAAKMVRILPPLEPLLLRWMPPHGDTSRC